MTSDLASHRPNRIRGAALLLALLYGLIAGGTAAPLPGSPRAAAVAATLDGHPGVALVAKPGKAAIKAPRADPDPLLLPASAALLRAARVRPGTSGGDLPVALAGGERPSPYRARAPPAA